MASTPTPNLRLELQTPGEGADVWGAKLNTAITMLENALTKRTLLTLGGSDVTLTTNDFVDDQSRALTLALSGTLTTNVNVNVPALSHLYLVENGCTGAFTVTVKTSAGSGVTVTQGATQALYCNATNVVALSVTTEIPQTVSELAGGVNPVVRTAEPGDFIRYGAVAGGSATTNVTAINNAMAVNKEVFCSIAGTYEVNSALLIQSNQTVRLSQGFTAKAAAAGVAGGRLWFINEVENVQMLGGVGDGNKAGNPAGTLFGLQMFNSENVRLFGVIMQNFPSDNVSLGAAGDGFYIGGFAGGSPGCADIELHGCRSLDNVRQGLSAVRVDGLAIIGGSYSGTTGNNPGGGINLEANPGLGTVSNVRIVGVELADNHSALILQESSENVVVTGCQMLRSRGTSLQISSVTNAVITCNVIAPAMTVSGPIIDVPASSRVTFAFNKIIGQGAPSAFEGAGMRFAIGSSDISVRHNTFVTTKAQALSLGSSALAGVPTRIDFSYNTLIDCLDPVASPARGPIAIGGNTGAGNFPVDVTIRNNTIRDTRGTPADFGIMLTDIPAATSAGYRIDGNTIDGVVTKFADNITGNVPPLCGTGAWNPANLADGAGETSPVFSVLGAAVGDTVEVYPPYALQGFLCTGAVSAADQVVIRVQNETGGAVDLANGTWRVRVKKFFEA